MTLALIRADEVNFPLFLHVLGAFCLVGATLTVATALLLAWRAEGDDRLVLTRFGFRTLLFATIPAYLVMRLAAEWVLSKESVDEDSTWIGVGYSVADGGLLLIVIATILAYLGLRRARAGGGGRSLANIAAVIGAVLVVVYLIAIWAMATKPA
jgi:hypothetical protein